MRPLRAVAHAHVHGAIFAFALALGVFVNFGALPMASQVLRLRINRVLSPLFVGTITIDRIRGIGLHGIEGLDAHVDDGDHERVIDVHGATAQVSTETLVRSLFDARGPVDIAIPELTLTNGDVCLDTDATGTPRIARAFALRAAAKEGEPPGREAHIALPRIHVVHALLRLQPDAPIDADFDDADASLSFSPTGLTIDLAKSRLVVRGLPENAEAKGAVAGHLEKPNEGALSTHASWLGTVGAIACQATAALEGAALDATVDASPATPDEVRTLLPAWPLAVPVAIHAEAQGALPRLDVSVHATAREGQVITVSGPLTLGAGVDAALHVEAEGLQGTLLAPALPLADFDGAGDATLAVAPSGAANGHVTFALASATWGGVAIPRTTLTADLSRTAGATTTVKATLAAHEPGAPTTASLRFGPSGASGTNRTKTVLSFDASATAPRLEAVPRLGGAASGNASIRAAGWIDLVAGTLDVSATGTADGIRSGPVAAEHARVEVGVAGSLRSPAVRVALDGDVLDVGPLHAHSFRGGATATASAGGITLHDVELDLRNHGPPLRVQAASIRIDPSGIAADEAVILGLGAPLGASFAKSPSGVSVQAEGAGVDLARVDTFVALPVASGTLAVDVDATVQRDKAVGHAKIELTSADVAGLSATTAHVDVRVHGRELRGHATASAPDLGQVDIASSSLELGPGNLVTAEPWRQSWGAIDATADIDLAKALARLARTSATGAGTPQLQASGSVHVGLRLERDSPSDVTPEVELTLATNALALSGGDAKAPWRLDGIDARVHARVDGETGATAFALELDDRDKEAPLATLEASSAAVPYGSLFSSQSGRDVRAALRTMPFMAHAEIPARPIASLPPWLGTAGLRGSLAAKVDWRGTVDKPDVTAVATLPRGPSDAKASALPLDFALSARYDGAIGNVALTGSRRGTTMLDATATVAARAPDILDGLASGEIPWTASMRAKLTKMPLRNIPALDDRQVQGTVTGEMAVTNLHEDARASASLSFDNLEVGDATCRSAALTASADGHAFDATLQIDDSNVGHLRAKAHSGLHWGRALIPAVDVAQAADASITAQHFRVALLLPFVSGSFTALDGTLDADARIAVDPLHGTATPQGSVRLKDGTFELTSMGGEFHGVQASLVLTPDGIVRLENAEAHGMNGQVEASATARLDGLSMSAARALVQIPRNDPIPLVFDGVLLGQLDGRFDATMTRRAGGMAVELQVPSMHVALPEGTASRDVQALGGIDGVSIGIDRSGDFVETPLDGATPAPTPAGTTPFTTRIDVHLGNDVQIGRGTDLDVHLEGEPAITIGSEVRVTGQIRLSRGRLAVKGEDFTIERGTVTFTGDDPSNPQVVLTAAWTAPDGTVIYADYVGPLKTGTVTLRSEPTRPQNEILALLLFGTVDDTQNRGAVVGAQAGGVVATAPINQALGGLNRTLDRLGLAGGVSTKIDTSTSNPRPEVELQIARDISLQVGYVLGVPPVTSPDTTLVTLNWNFLRKWSLAATCGDQGSTILDVVWQHRY
jgi:translocation and assembly module TamB